MRLRQYVKPLVSVAIVALLIAVGFFTRHRWFDRLFPNEAAKSTTPAPVAGKEETQVKVSEQAQKNLRLNPQPLSFVPFARSIEVPGTIVDRPGVSDRGVTSPVAGVIAEIHAFPRDTVRAGDPLFTVRLVSEYVHNAQAELRSAVRDIAFNRERWERQKDTAPEGTRVEIDNEYKRLLDRRKALRLDLQIRGLESKLDEIERGEFVTEMVVRAPPPHRRQSLLVSRGDVKSDPLAYEVQSLKAELGQQVQPGQVLAEVANHQDLQIEGSAFKHELPLVELAARKGWPIEVDFFDEGAIDPEKPQVFTIHSFGNVANRASNTTPFYLPLTNQSEAIERGERAVLVWRYRPGQRVRLRIPIEEKKNQLVVPASAIVRDDLETYLFRQNGDQFERKAVHVLYEDRRNAVIAYDGSVSPGVNVAFNGAAALNRALKSKKDAGAPAGFHVHADGSIHANH